MTQQELTLPNSVDYTVAAQHVLTIRWRQFSRRWQEQPLAYSIMGMLLDCRKECNQYRRRMHRARTDAFELYKLAEYAKQYRKAHEAEDKVYAAFEALVIQKLLQAMSQDMFAEVAAILIEGPLYGKDMLFLKNVREQFEKGSQS